MSDHFRIPDAVREALALRHPTITAFDDLGRKLTCTRCGTVSVIFVSTDDLDDETFVGFCCLRPKIVEP